LNESVFGNCPPESVVRSGLAIASSSAGVSSGAGVISVGGGVGVEVGVRHESFTKVFVSSVTAPSLASREPLTVAELEAEMLVSART
jgi:hypothetical protein